MTDDQSNAGSQVLNYRSGDKKGGFSGLHSSIIPPPRPDHHSKIPLSETEQTQLEERILRRIPAEILIFAIVLAAGSLLFFAPLTSLFILAGGAFSAASFAWLKSSVGRLLSPGRGHARRQAIRSGLLLYLGRLGLLLGIFLIIILLFPRMILAFAAGFSSVILVFFIEAVLALAHSKLWKN